MKKRKGGSRVFVPNRLCSTTRGGTFFSTFAAGRINRTPYGFDGSDKTCTGVAGVERLSHKIKRVIESYIGLIFFHNRLLLG